MLTQMVGIIDSEEGFKAALRKTFSFPILRRHVCIRAGHGLTIRPLNLQVIYTQLLGNLSGKTVNTWESTGGEASSS
jgi:hypothetical protein